MTVNWKSYVDAGWLCKNAGPGRYRAVSRHTAEKDGDSKTRIAYGPSKMMCD